MRTRLAVLTTAACIAGSGIVPATAAATAPVSRHVQFITLTASTGDGSTYGTAELTVTREGRHGYRLRGTVHDSQGSTQCLTLRATELHLGTDWGGDTVTRVCTAGATVTVDALTRHHDVVLMVHEPYTMNWESKIVKLTG